MTHTSPIFFLAPLLEAASRLQPPGWLVSEGQHRLVLLLNHVLMQEPEAQARLARRRGSVLQLKWGAFSLPLLLTPAGLADVASPERTPDLVLSLEDQAPWSVAGQLLQGQKPSVQIEGDVQLAAEVAWLVDHLRWDIEEDLARVLGDAPAHALGRAARRLAAALQALVLRRAGAGDVKAGA